MVTSTMPIQSEPVSAEPVSCGFPRRFLRALLFGHGMTAGSRVLEIGGGEHSLVPFLERLGIDVQAASSSAEPLFETRRGSARGDFHDVAKWAAPPWESHQFDAILVRNLAAWRENLFGTEALAATAGLLTLLRPGGHLVYFDRYESARGRVPSGHGIACFARQLSSFPGACRVMRVRERWGLGALFDRVFRQGLRTCYKLTSLQVPQNAFSRPEWQRIAQSAGWAEREHCCDWSLRRRPSPAVRRAA